MEGKSQKSLCGQAFGQDFHLPQAIHAMLPFCLIACESSQQGVCMEIEACRTTMGEVLHARYET